MASITKQPNGRPMIQFTDAGGKRRTVRLGKASQRSADAVKVRIENLVSAQIAGHTPDDDTQRWLAGIDDLLRDKLAAVGLVDTVVRMTLREFLDDVSDSRTDVKHLTRLAWEATNRRLCERFGDNCQLRSITPGDADNWRVSPVTEGLSTNTVGKHVKHAKHFSQQQFGDGCCPRTHSPT